MRIPTERIRPLLQPLVDEHPLHVVGEMLGCSHETVRSVMSGDKEWVRLSTLDRWVTRLERPDFLHVELADLYAEEDEPSGDEDLEAQLVEARARARYWNQEARRFRQQRDAWKLRYRKLREETENWRQAEKYARQQAAKRAA